jgi:hypothetical protein
MNRTFLPTGDNSLYNWALNFSTLLTANFAAYGLAQSMASTYSSKFNTYKTALTAAKSDATRGKQTVYVKNQAKKDLISYTRLVAGQISRTVSVSNAQKTELGLIVRKKPSRQPAPTTRPKTAIETQVMRTLGIRIWDDSTEYKRAKAPNTLGAKVYTFVGSDYPSNPTLWAYQGDATRGKYEIVFPDTVPSGAEVWVCCAWYNRKGETGPISLPISTTIQGGGSQQEAEMKIAA